ncbi:tyrosine-type recombinase/integrase [Lutimaribacter saemankumensis]|uniref:Site-specific recombinase XerD n=1 Tax=Lutimaribacter saemankumensis TaxID=490829 RepID=A0A1G8KAJ4_9RHOB|nr:site-specific integrase [Lutimaribacter saemankumensis]SDI40442.1 Site-specific recombinase XerD [Lutimaribacter saemankumensis]
MPKAPKTVREACDAWLKECQRNNLERATIRSYRGHVIHHIDQKIGDLLVGELTRGDVAEFLDDLQDEGVSRSMTKKVLGSLRSALDKAMQLEWVDRNVARDVKLKRNRRDEEERIIPTKDEIKIMIENVPDRHRPLIVTAIFTGMRISELRGLTWDCVDFEARLIHIRKRADRFNEMGKPKSRTGRRSIPMAPMVHDTLQAWREDCPKGDVDLVFPNGKGNVENHSNIHNRVLVPLLLENGIVDEEGKPKFSFHALRHAAASLFIEQNWPPKKIQALMGHSSINVTMDVYGHLFESPEEDVALFAKLEEDLLAA